MPIKKKSPAASSPERRSELLSIAAEVFAAHGYDATTVRRIADEAGMLAGSLYHHFDSKESMVDEILSTFLAGLRAGYDQVLGAGPATTAGPGAAPGPGPWETIEALVAESFRQIDRNRAAVAIYRKEAEHLSTRPGFAYLTDARAAFEDPWLRALERGVADGSFRADLDVRTTGRFLRDMVWGAASWYRPGDEPGAEELARRCLSLMNDGIASRT
ncbi:MULTISPECIES: TetR/AcrR family transcriptional regulator [Streptomyces]|uniref:TetR/AcrR family transcriptional regulator n=1 Tax=Streptomyces TaxID=1883 RepID=UPI0006FD682B|nr:MULTISPECIES: TetR/AcrR family transcriptional regulator [Streptomyces]KQX79515.1 TetR family transcriptional regulator [Streptomyces sp. Root1319]KQZ20969.1 TetR family transcriptional regulator [Streptomyces sp. Root55]RPK74671.1 HTH-type transcriptional repressor KstR2 [Streptomyces sp. ADI97-07]WRY81555.1 TetR/AcrR family transcriptional regulator [Streptomyces clavifer]WUC27315.1 TetR/AcrR family transcriptional regulator [Streptomyces clavifer]